MRAAGLLALLLAACGNGADGPSPPAPRRSTFRRWPDDTAILLRLPPSTDLQERQAAHEALLRALGRPPDPAAAFLGLPAPAGSVPDAPHLALTSGGGWMRVLSPPEPLALRPALAALPREVTPQELDGFLALFRGTRPGEREEPPLPAGDIALRVHHHPLLGALADASDSLEADLALGSAGLDARARLTPGPASPTARLLADARAGEGGLVDFLPQSLFVRVEMTFPPTALAAPLARRLGRHLGVDRAHDAVVAERFLREALSGVDPVAGIAFGCEARQGEETLVVVARAAPGPASPILAKLARDERSSFGALVLDRRDAPGGLLGWTLWIAQATPTLDGLPECLWDLVGRLADEERGLEVAYAEAPGYAVLAVGPRADILARDAKARLEAGSSRTPATTELFRLRGLGKDYVLGAVVEGKEADLPAADAAALRAAFGAAEGAKAPEAVAIAGFRGDAALDLLVRVLY